MFLSEEVILLKELKDNLENDLLECEEKMQLVLDRLGDFEKVFGVDESGVELELCLDIVVIIFLVRMVMLI